MRTISYTFAAGETKVLNIFGAYFRILSGLALDINFMRNNAFIGENAVAVDAGYFSQPQGGFDRLDIKSASAQTIKIAVSMGQGGYDIPPTGLVTISNVNGGFTQAQATVTNLNMVMIAANTARRYLLIQNNDLASALRVAVDGTAATATRGIRVAPGGSIEFASFCPTGGINVMTETAGSGASNIDYVQG